MNEGGISRSRSSSKVDQASSDQAHDAKDKSQAGKFEGKSVKMRSGSKVPSVFSSFMSGVSGFLKNFFLPRKVIDLPVYEPEQQQEVKEKTETESAGVSLAPVKTSSTSSELEKPPVVEEPLPQEPKVASDELSNVASEKPTELPKQGVQPELPPSLTKEDLKRLQDRFGKARGEDNNEKRKEIQSPSQTEIKLQPVVDDSAQNPESKVRNESTVSEDPSEPSVPPPAPLPPPPSSSSSSISSTSSAIPSDETKATEGLLDKITKAKKELRGVKKPTSLPVQTPGLKDVLQESEVLKRLKKLKAVDEKADERTKKPEEEENPEEWE